MHFFIFFIHFLMFKRVFNQLLSCELIFWVHRDDIVVSIIFFIEKRTRCEVQLDNENNLISWNFIYSILSHKVDKYEKLSLRYICKQWKETARKCRLSIEIFFSQLLQSQVSTDAMTMPENNERKLIFSSKMSGGELYRRLESSISRFNLIKSFAMTKTLSFTSDRKWKKRKLMKRQWLSFRYSIELKVVVFSLLHNFIERKWCQQNTIRLEMQMEW